MAQARRIPEGLIAFAIASAAVFVAGAWATAAWSMAMPMPCGDAAMALLPMPGQTWAGTSASFAAMWLVMMVAMMTPSLAPALWRYRQSIAGARHRAWMTVVAAAGYYFIWLLVGVAAYPLVLAFAQAGSRIAAGGVVLAAGFVQLSAWKQSRLDRCGVHACECAALHADMPGAWLHGMNLGMRCVLCCGNLMAILLVTGVMDFAAMAALTVAITLERVLPAGGRVAKCLGVLMVAAGACMLISATG